MLSFEKSELTASKSLSRRSVSGLRESVAQELRLPQIPRAVHTSVDIMGRYTVLSGSYAVDVIDLDLTNLFLLLPSRIQIKLLKLLAALGMGDRSTSENMYAVISQVWGGRCEGVV